ncbi:hypothetical protein NPIL_634841 [Nephila pilipes]|uniref:Uncharacterized protein n=1 Tax=Nephila pilipes TaxID=299642 RepID=A0A8X6QZ09_NEPPI|nr:hypothetical protein NPIL_634841 [Nephila pilipes]
MHHVDSELDVVVTAGKLYDPYFPITPWKDGDIVDHKIYKTRRCITSEIRCDTVLLISLNCVVEKCGEMLGFGCNHQTAVISLDADGTVISSYQIPSQIILFDFLARSQDYIVGTDDCILLSDKESIELSVY